MNFFFFLLPTIYINDMSKKQAKLCAQSAKALITHKGIQNCDMNSVI